MSLTPKQQRLTAIILGIVALGIFGFLMYSRFAYDQTGNQNQNINIIVNRNANAPVANENMNTQPARNTNVNVPVPAPQGIIITSPQANVPVSSPVLIRGSLQGDGWTAFEANAGRVQLTDDSGKVLGTAALPVKGNWMTLPVEFETVLQFTTPATETGTLIFSNENPSGEASREKRYALPVRFESGTTTVSVFFTPANQNGNASCDAVAPFIRTMQKTPTLAQAALRELFAGPTPAEKQQGYTSWFSDATKDILISVKIVNQTAYVNLKDIRNIIPNASASCGSAQFLAQIEQTLKQFPSITRVILAINGDPQTLYDWLQIGCGPSNDNCDKSQF